MENHLMESFMSTGFAIGVAGFVLLRLERELAELRKAIEKLARCQVCIVDNPKVELTS